MKNKYRNRPVRFQGKYFHSQGERDRYIFLCELECQGKIKNLHRQVPFSIDVNGVHICKYIADFTYELNGETVVCDFKGCRTPEFNLKEKLMLAVHGIKINVVKSPTKWGD